MRRESTNRSASRGLPGSSEAKRSAAVVLEVLSGVQGPRAGSDALGVSLGRYYALESRALGGLIAALEPRPKGRRRSPEQEVDRLGRERQRLERELVRAQALVRAAHRALGLAPSPGEDDGGRLAGKSTTKGKLIRRRRTMRAARAITRLRQEGAEGPPASAGKEAGGCPPDDHPRGGSTSSGSKDPSR